MIRQHFNESRQKNLKPIQYIKKLAHWILKNKLTTFVIAFIITRISFFDYTFIPSESMSNTIRTTDFVIFKKIRKFDLMNLPVVGRYFYSQKYNHNKAVYNLSKIKRGDLILWSDGQSNYVKRVLGLPGDTMEFNQFDVVVNGNSTIFQDRYHHQFFSEPETATVLHDNMLKEEVFKVTSQVEIDDEHVSSFNTYYSRKLPNSDVNYFKVRQNAPYRKIIVPEGYVFIRGDNRDYSSDTVSNGTFVRLDSIIGTAMYAVLGSSTRFGIHSSKSNLAVYFKRLITFPYNLLKYIFHLSPRMDAIMNKKQKKATVTEVKNLDDMKIKAWQQTIDYTFHNTALIRDSLTHPSMKNSNSNFEKLEILGDAVLRLCILSIIYPDCKNEKECASKVSQMTSKECIYDVARKLGMNNYAIWSGENHHEYTILSDMCEAVIGAIFLDSGLEAATKFVKTFWPKDMNLIDYKSTLQEWSHKNQSTFSYQIIKSNGKSHAMQYTTELTVSDINNNIVKVRGKGTSIKNAEKNAAMEFLKEKNIIS